MSEYGQGGDYVLQLDTASVNRVFDGALAPDDPDVLVELALLFDALAAPNGDREPAPGVVAALAAAVRAGAPSRPVVPAASRRRRATVIGAFAAGAVVGMTGLAAADVLPDPIQHVTAVVLDKVGVHVSDPHDAGSSSGRRTNPGGRPSTPPGQHGEQPGNRPAVPPGQEKHEGDESPSDTAPGQVKEQDSTNTGGGGTGNDGSGTESPGNSAPGESKDRDGASAGSPLDGPSDPSGREPADASGDNSGRPATPRGQDGEQPGNRKDTPPGQDKTQLTP